ncbi:hypothetical protein P5P86_16890 [Nocardioides sp. BP30]|uniref:hypothetical protein n=1 Tax=Nocardioides sp. BP30 TaxID=3036374 RepID=UPI00246838D7|nr:hypothetical protein [Nocardioides sp. BP30]WGL51624.1 hypothetical protein P5P86_16890 [Nocardioides sp. BP30]
MSYDLAVWADVAPFAGHPPQDAYATVTDLLEDDEALAAPMAEVIDDFVDALLARWPALGEPGDERSPWAMGPEIGDCLGACIYITMTFPGAEFAVPVIAAEARARGLVCFDPQRGEAI